MSVKNKGPLPGGGSADDPPVSRQRRAVLRQLRAQTGPVTVGEFAAVCGLHTNTVREHLDALIDAGLAIRERAPAMGRGRPAWRYRARPPQQSAVHEYAGLAAVLAGQIARTSADPQRQAFAAGEDWGRALVAADAAGDASADAPANISGDAPAAADGAGDPPGDTPEQGAAGTRERARRRVLDLLDEIGFAPEADEEAAEVRLPRCPFIEVAREYPGVICNVHAGLARGAVAALGGAPERVSLHPFAEPHACRLQLDTEPGPPGCTVPPGIADADGPAIDSTGGTDTRAAAGAADTGRTGRTGAADRRAGGSTADARTAGTADTSRTPGQAASPSPTGEADPPGTPR